jgi:hypothetical protein
MTFEKTTIVVEEDGNSTHDTAYNQAEQTERVPHKIVGYNCFPATVLEQSEDVLTSLDVTVAINAFQSEFAEKNQNKSTLQLQIRQQVVPT